MAVIGYRAAVEQLAGEILSLAHDAGRTVEDVIADIDEQVIVLRERDADAIAYAQTETEWKERRAEGQA